jgi:hypothetical protein
MLWKIDHKRKVLLKMVVELTPTKKMEKSAAPSPFTSPINNTPVLVRSLSAIEVLKLLE